MALTYVKIADNTLGSNTGTVTFDNISGSYTDLLLRISARSTETAFTMSQALLKINNNSSSLHSYRWMRADGSTTGTGSTQNSNNILLGWQPSSTQTSNTFGNIEVYLPNYTASMNKPVDAYSVSEGNSATVNYISSTAGLFRSTSAITRLDIICGNSTNWVTNSSFFLYGIKKD